MKKNLGIIITTFLTIIVLVVIGILFPKNKEEKGKSIENEIIKQIPSGKASNLVNTKELENVETVLQEAKLDNLDTFISWIKEFNKESIKNSGMVEEWTEIEKIKYNEGVLADRWEKKHKQSDSDCRMTAFLLLKDHISMNKTISESGSYLMFDIDAIENNQNYEILKEDKDRFVTLFNEIDVKDKSKENIKNIYSNKWKEYGISIREGKVSLITVIMHDNYDDVIFVGHTGILIELEDRLLFIEKIAFEQPYQVSVLGSREDLKEMLFSRKEYFGDNTEEGPFIYEDDKLLFSYK